MTTKHWLLLPHLRGAGDWALLALRLCVGAFLVWGVWDNITSAARMEEFVVFLRRHGFVRPDWLAPLSVWAQFFCGLAFIAGLGTRWAGWLCAFNFAVALAMVDAPHGVRAAFPSAMLLCFGVFAGTHGAGRLSVDRALGA